ncbi:serine/threonine-protein kinase pim-1-like [Xiphophorus couchianus]|uniref:serine/threonine-protein kinase pim-1-like n=1 Tax=Xiphophorus couchianus TaxID=32473 RepID=UPI0010170FB2|nr:serine/threonine-protein kinase pim-1-like [Xiphophorus couchianus]
MVKERKRKGKTPALRRQRDNNSWMTPPIIESVQECRPKKRKRVQDKTPRKRIKVSATIRAATTCQDHIKRKMTEEVEGCSTPTKKKKELLQQVQTKETSSSMDISSGDIRKQNLKRKADDFEEPPTKKKSKKEQVTSQRAKFQKKYTELHLLGEGGFGSVFAGYRQKDKLPVAIKHIPKENVFLKHKDENGRKMAMEVAIMLKLSNLTTSSSGQLAMVSLLDWYELEEELLLVMERPMPSEDLFVYLDEHEGCLNEEEAKIILKQLVEATIQLQDANIFHRDIKVENVLIKSSSEGPQAYLIDFGLSCFDRGRKFELLRGTRDHVPPEFYRLKKYTAGPTTVWQLGVLLFEILHNKMFKTISFLTNKLKINKRLSKNCQNLMTKCLKEHPKERPTLEELLSHPWFS